MVKKEEDQEHFTFSTSNLKKRLAKMRTAWYSYLALRERSGAETKTICGNGSVVEHRLAKARVASSNLVFRSQHSKRSAFLLFMLLKFFGQNLKKGLQNVIARGIINER